MRLLVFVSFILIVSACAQRAEKPDAQKPQVAREAQPSALSEKEILAKYSLAELDGVRNLLQYLKDSGSTYSAEGESFLSCRITPDLVAQLMPRLESLIDKHLSTERKTYSANPVSYARAHAFDSCASKCACGALEKVISPIQPRSFSKTRDRSTHQGFLKKLKIKAARQSAEESRTCAKNQAWFCDSELRSYLEARSN